MDEESMLSDCENVVDIPSATGGPGYNQWEQEFLESLRNRIDEGRTLTEPQLAVLKKLWDRI